MKKFSEFICKNKLMVLIISLILLVLSFIGMNLTKINYDILVYLPDDIETIKGENILTNDFNMGAYAMVITDNLSGPEILKVEEEMRKVEGVNKVLSAYDALGSDFPIEMLPSDIKNHLNNDNSNLLIVTFEESTSSEKTIDAVRELRNISDNIKVGGMSSMVLDTMDLSNSEIAIYIVIAVILCLTVLAISLDSYLVPVLLLLNIGMAIMYNLGTNIFLGEISYITKALVAVLQLGVTTDFSIFLYHAYENKKNKMNKEKAMEEAISETFSSVTGSSLTTIAGFLVLCLMNLTLGKDLGIVMAKGVLLGLITVLTVFPALLLTFDKLIDKTSHKVIIKPFNKINNFIVKNYMIIFIVFILLLFPMYKANSKVEVYYKIDETLPETLESISSNNLIKEKFNIVSPEIILINKDIKDDKLSELSNKLNEVDGINLVLSKNTLTSLGLTTEMIPEELSSTFSNDKYTVIFVNSIYEVASDELNNQLTSINTLVKSYDKDAIVAGEGALMKDLITISDKDFNNVNTWSVICILIILMIVLRRFLLPVLLVCTIEFAIFINLGTSYFTGDILPFVAPITLGTIQLGATIDYAILLTTNYLNRRKTMSKEEAIKETLKYTSTSIIVSAMCFFAATFGVGVYSDLEMVGSLCSLISRGALISMIVVLVVLPSVLLVFDKILIKESDSMKNNNIKKVVNVFFFSLLLIPSSLLALSKDETVYTILNNDGSVKKTTVNESILNKNNLKEINDYTILNNIVNLNEDSSYKKDNNSIIWTLNNSNVSYKGETTKDLPINMSVIYKLNGEEKELKDILGKSGKVDIIITYKNTDKHNVSINGKNETMYTPFVIVTGTYFDNKTNSNIKVSGGKVVENASKTFIVGLSMPGLMESLGTSKSLNKVIISLETTKFELNSIYSVVTPKVVDESILSNFNKLDSIYTSVDSLQSNMNLIVNSTKELKDGSNLLKNTLDSKVKSLNVESYLTEEQISKVKVSAKKGVEESLTDEYLNLVSESVWNEVKEEMLSSTDSELEGKVKNILVSYLTDANLLNDYINCETGKALVNEGHNMSEEQKASCLVIKNDKALPYFEKLTTEVSTYVAEKVSKTVAKDLTKKVSLTTAESVSALVYESTIKESVNSTKESLILLLNSITLIDNGINSLYDGLNQYNTEGINKISDLSLSVKDYEERVKALVNLSNDYNSFAGSKMNGETKFIMLINSEKVKEETKTVKVTEKTSLWTKIKNLFK